MTPGDVGDSGTVKVIDAREADARVATARKRRAIAIAVSGAVLMAITIWFFVLRDTSSDCTRWLGGPEELAGRVEGGKPLRGGYTHDGAYGCHQSYMAAGTIGDAIELSTERVRSSASEAIVARRKDEGAKAYADRVDITLPGGDAYLFVAGHQPGPSVDAMQADVMKRVGTSADPMGDMLASLPPEKDVALFVADEHTLVTMRFDPADFSVEAVRAIITAAARRSRE